MGKYFGTDGFRGEANVNLTVEHAYKVGRFLGWFYGKNHEDGKAKIVIGKDTRRSSYMFEYSLVAGLTASGADAYLLHVTTTPSVSYVTRTEDFDCGIMISASHNPYYDNGIKLINDKGEKMREDVIGEIEKYLDGEMAELPFATREKIGCTVDYAAGRNRYMGYLMSLAIYSFKGMRIGLDAANGSAWSLAKSIFDALGAKTYVIHAEPDGLNINNGCGSTHIESLCELVKREHLDAGFAFDGDADRCIAVDENGMEVHGDYILYVCGKYLKECGRLQNNTVVATIMSNMGLFKAMKREGIEVCVTTVGDKYVNEAMVANGYVLGGEQSGHIIFSKHATTGDGILTALMLMEVILEKKQTLAKLASEYEVYPQVLKNVKVKDKKAAQDDEKVQAEVKKVTESLGSDGRRAVPQPPLRHADRAGYAGTSEKSVDHQRPKLPQDLLRAQQHGRMRFGRFRTRRNGGHDRKVLRRHAAQSQPARTAVRTRKADHDSRGEGGLRTRSGQRHAGLASAGRERQIDRHQRHRRFDPLQRTSRTDRPRPEPAAEGALGLRLRLDAARLQFVPRGRTPQDGTVARRSPRPASGGGGKTAGGGLR